MTTGLGENYFSLEGDWLFSIDPDDKGINQKWYNKKLAGRIKLPGTLDENGIGKKSDLKPALTKEVLHHLNRKYSYTGKAWYQKEINIPEEWAKKRIVLFLERVIWETQVWIDSYQVGVRNSLSTPHIYDISKYATPGKHLLTVRVDNTQKYNIGSMCHAYSDETQTVWNGIIGKIQLYATDKVWLSDIQIFPDINKKKLRTDITINNDTKDKISGKIKLKAQSNSDKEIEFTEKTADFEIDSSFSLLHVDYDMGENVFLWDEFEPNLYDLRVSIESDDGNSFFDRQSISFGMRSFAAKGTEIFINNKKIFLRGTLECCVFPLTGYPPMNVDQWRNIFKTAGNYGLNHIRFHSWCPPEEAFKAADIEGFYLHVELPVWAYDIGKDLRRDDFLISEANRIIETYGNHPSFCMISMGNELEGDFNYLHKLVRHLKNKDSRHLYTSTTFTFQEPHGKWPEPVDDFFVTQQTLKGWLRGQGFFNEKEPGNMFDSRDSLQGIDIPTVSHEIGQYAVYPDLEEIVKYKGILEPLNFVAVKEDLKKKGLLEQARDFTIASGKLSLLLYKEDIELAFRTEGLRGFQLLDLHDFPGQSTALVGLLDAFWDSKNIVNAKDFRRFCSPTVPLLRTVKKVYKTDETFNAKLEIAHYGSEDLKGVDVKWHITNSQEFKIAEGKFSNLTIASGKNSFLGDIDCSFEDIDKAVELTVEIEVCDTDISNSWNIWVYPEVNLDSSGIEICDEYNQAAKDALMNGKKVLLLPDTSSLKNTIPGTFVPVFWSPVHFPDQPGTMGLLCNNQHPALSEFPTKNHSDWQWWDLNKRSSVMILDDLPDKLQPIVQVVDNFVRNHKLADIFEAKAYNGKLVVCSLDLKNDMDKRPVARQLLYSILNYMKSEKFNPSVELNEKNLLSLFK